MELDPNNELVKFVCPDCGRQYREQLRYAEEGSSAFVPHYGRCYAKLCQDCVDKVRPVVEPILPPTRNGMLREVVQRGYEQMKRGKTAEAQSAFLFTIAEILLDLHEADQEQRYKELPE